MREYKLAILLKLRGRWGQNCSTKYLHWDF